MATPLTAEEAYFAGKQDLVKARVRTYKKCKGAFDTDVFAEELARLWQARIGRGELPSIQEKAS